MSFYVCRSYAFGHPCTALISGDRVGPYHYNDTGEEVPRGRSLRRCPKCGDGETKDGHDPCIAKLPGVEFACCGHGVERAYVKFYDGEVVRGSVEEIRAAVRQRIKKVA
jgi:hypothetical protein